MSLFKSSGKRRPEFAAEAKAAKGKKYIVMSQSDRIEYATDSVAEAVAAFGATVIIRSREDGLPDDTDRVRIVTIPDEIGGILTPTGKGGIVAFALPEGAIDDAGLKLKDTRVLCVAFGLSIEEWDELGPDGNKVDELAAMLMAGTERKKYRVIYGGFGESFGTDDIEEAFRGFAKAATDESRKYGYGPGNPVAIQFASVDEELLEHYPGKFRMEKKAVVVASVSGTGILLAVLEGVDYEEWEPVANRYLGEALGGPENVKSVKGEEVKMNPPTNIRSAAEGMKEIGGRYAVMAADNSVVLKTDDEYEAIDAFYKAQEAYAIKLKDEHGEDGTVNYEIIDGPKWSDTELPTLLAVFQVGDKKRSIAILGMSKRAHDLFMEARAIPTVADIAKDKRRATPWGTTLH